MTPKKQEGVAPQTDVIKDFVLEVLKKYGFNYLPQEEKNQYLEQFTAQAEKRVGVAIRPRLTEKSAKEFEQLISSASTSPEEWNVFWTTYVPDYIEIVKSTLRAYDEEIGRAFAS